MYVYMYVYIYIHTQHAILLYGLHKFKHNCISFVVVVFRSSGCCKLSKECEFRV